MQQFDQQLKELKILSINQIEEFENTDEFNFKYALLQEGRFIHKWTDNLRQSLSVRYKLNENGRQCIGDDTFRNIGFNIDAATISKSYFDFEQPNLEHTENLAKNYGVETCLGYWIPKQALETLLFEKNGFEYFKETLKNQLNQRIEDIKEKINKDLKHLMDNNLIDKPNLNPAESFESKMRELLKNELKLKRIFSKYEIFSLPYDIGQKKEIENLFDEILDLIKSRSRKNITMKAFLELIEMKNLMKKVSMDNFRQSISDSLK